MKPLKVAMLVHSTNPRGGVVHAMELCNALHELGHHVTLFAPDASGRGFFRKSAYAQAPIAVAAAEDGLLAMVQQRIADYEHYFTHIADQDFDIYHAHDGISGNALATLMKRGLVPGYVRTVHHVDDFLDQQLNQLQLRSIHHAERVFCVSNTWRRYLLRCCNLTGDLVPTGVDRKRFQAASTSADASLRVTLGLRENAKVFLSIGGIEPRKNTLNILKAFEMVHRQTPNSQLVIAGGTTLLDHKEYNRLFQEAARTSHLEFGAGRDVIVLPRIPDDAMPSLYRIAEALVFASIKEGFGLVVLEALASGTPIILSRIEPFTEYMPFDACLWVDPQDVASIASAMLDVMQPAIRKALRDASHSLAETFSWSRSAHVHAELYQAALDARLKDQFSYSDPYRAGVHHA